MEENTVLEPQTEPAQPQVEAAQPAKEKPSVANRVINAITRTLIIISDVAFVGIMAYLFVLLVLSVMGTNVNALFSIDAIDLGFFDALGVLVWVAIAIAAAVLVALAIGFVKCSQNYYLVLKTARDEQLKVILSPGNTIAFVFVELLFFVALGFVSIGFVQNEVYNITAILTFICTAALALAVVFAIIFAIMNRVAYSKLPDDKKAEVKVINRTVRKKVIKKERKISAGKLY